LTIGILLQFLQEKLVSKRLNLLVNKRFVNFANSK